MVTERVDVSIVNGQTQLIKVEERVPLFAIVPDRTFDLGQYPGPIDPSAEKRSHTGKPKAELPDHIAVTDTCYL